MTFTPPNKILRTSDDITLEFMGVIPKTKLNAEQYAYKYVDGIMAGFTINYTEDEIKKQLKNYWKEVK